MIVHHWTYINTQSWKLHIQHLIVYNSDYNDFFIFHQA
jgi:hypothetical protein